MPNPYDDILSSDDNELRREPRQEPAAKPQPLFTDPDPLTDPRFQYDGPEPLEIILNQIVAFDEKGEVFSRLLSELRVIDHKVESQVKRMFFVSDDPHTRGTLIGEKQYHLLQEKKFRMIIEPMRELAEIHLSTLKKFNTDIDEHYFSVEKGEKDVESDKVRAMDGINLQRKILAEATDSLQILEAGLEDTERRVKDYVNAGGRNNISQSEFDMMARKREELTSGREHHFDFTFFDINLLDKTALSLGVWQKETSSQYLGKLGKAFNH